MAPPRNRRKKVGSMRIDAALDSMRPMGFPDDVVRKSVKDLLKVYGEDGWFFIEEASYKLLIEKMLEGQQEGSRVGDDAGGSGENYGSLDELFDKKDCCKEEKCLQLEIDVEQHQGKKCQVDYDFIPKSSNHLKDEAEQAQLGAPADFAPTCSPMDRAPNNQTRKLSFGWLCSDDENDVDEFLLLPPADGC